MHLPFTNTDRTFLLDGGLETDFIFNRGFELPAFAAHTLLETRAGRVALREHFNDFLNVASEHGFGFMIEAPTWRAQRFFVDDLNTSVEQLARINDEAVAFVRDVISIHQGENESVVVGAQIGPRGDGYVTEHAMSVDQACDYHREQIGWLQNAGVDMATAYTIHNIPEAIGIVRAAADVNLPIAISLTVETDGRLPAGDSLAKAISKVDEATNSSAAYFMVNCAHPDHFQDALQPGPWLKRIRGVRCNPSRKSHAELDAADTLDSGDPIEFGDHHEALLKKLPWANVFGGCCGSDVRHVTEIAKRVARVVG